MVTRTALTTLPTCIVFDAVDAAPRHTFPTMGSYTDDELCKHVLKYDTYDMWTVGDDMTIVACIPGMSNSSHVSYTNLAMNGIASKWIQTHLSSIGALGTEGESRLTRQIRGNVLVCDNCYLNDDEDTHYIELVGLV
jgi:hypothetical protein